MNMHAYADDTQLYLHCRRDDTTAAVTRLETCLNHVSYWMAANRLKLNAEKTELLWAGSSIALELSSGAVVYQYSLAVSLPLQGYTKCSLKRTVA